VATLSSNRQNGLRWAGLSVGLAGVVWTLLFLLATNKWHPEMSHLLNVMLFYSLPFLAMVAIAWKWPLIGGILLIAVGLFWVVAMVFVFSAASSMPLRDVLIGLAYVILSVSLPMWVSGILFLLSRKRE
jgi:uncharacterized membrane protein